MTHSEALDICKRRVTEAGFTVSAGSWGDETRAYAFSVEGAGPLTFGHSQYAVEARHVQCGTWVFYHNNTPLPLEETL